MSLFGSSPDESGLSTPAARSDQKPSLFNDEQPANTKGGSSLFDDEPTNASSPWSIPTPKKPSNANPVKTLLPPSAVPESYIDIFDALRTTEYKAEGERINVSSARKLFEGSGLDGAEQDRILNLVTGGHGNLLGCNEFNVLLALVGLSQEGEEASSLDSVDERRKSE